MANPRIVGRSRRSRALLAPCRRLVESARADGGAAQVQSGAAGLHSRPGGRALWPRRPRSSTASKACACSISAAAAASCRSRWRASARRWSAPIRRRKISRWRSAHAEQSGVAIDYRATTAEELADAGERFDVVLAMEVVEHVADVELVRRHLRVDGQAGRADDRGDAQPHAQEFRARHRRRRIRAALAAARHASMGQIRHAERARARDRARRPAGDRRARRDLQSVRRPLAVVVRHGRELHAGRER